MIVVEADQPARARGQVLVEIRASAVNQMDVQVRAGGWARQVRRFRRAGPVLTGFEFSGVARSDGARIRAGQRVIGYSPVLDGPRTHAEFAAMAERDLQVLPDALDDEAAAALVVMGLTAIGILERLSPLKRGDRCLVAGAAGGVGIYALQLAMAQGADVVAVGSGASASWLRGQGVGEVRAHEDGGWWRDGDRFDLVIDTPGKSSFAQAAPRLAPGGMYVSTNPQADIAGFARAAVSSRRAGYLMLLRSHPAGLQRLIDLALAGTLKPAVDSVFPLDEADAAFDRFATRGKHGRVLLKIAA
jgi:NADPH:quinone reductase-like Zn-dependent oxidoreductase